MGRRPRSRQACTSTRIPRPSSTTRSMLSRRVRDHDTKLGAAAIRPIADLDRPARGRDQMLAHREAEAGADPRRLGREERVEHARAVGRPGCRGRRRVTVISVAMPPAAGLVAIVIVPPSAIACAAFCTRLTRTCCSAWASIAIGVRRSATSVTSCARALRSCGARSAATWRTTAAGSERPGATRRRSRS